MTNTTCTCGASKAPHARVCFTCLAAEPRIVRARVSIAIGEPGPRFYAYRADGAIRRFATHQAAAAWSETNG